MQLITILLIAISILTFLSGVSVISGSRKDERTEASFFFFTTICSLIWAVFIGVFLMLPESTSISTAEKIAKTYYIAAPLMCWGLMSYTCHKFKSGRIAIGIFGAICLTFIVLILKQPFLLYSGIILSETEGNSVQINQDLFNLLYGLYHFTTVFLYMVALFYTARKTKSAHIKKANLMVLYGFTITGIIALIFNFLLPVLGKYDTVWAGPLAMSFAWVFHYYAILKYRLLDLSGSWLKVLSYIIIMSLAAIIYLSIFFIIFIALFKVPKPSTPVIILNIIMITVVLLLFPALNEISSYIRSLTSVHEVDLVYLVKKLNQASKEYINYRELTEFLAEHLHFNYVGLLIDDNYFDSRSKNAKITAANLDIIKKIKPQKNIWLPLNEELKTKLKPLGIEAIADLRDARGESVGKILLGRPLGNMTFKSRDMSEIETALILIATAISSEKTPR